MLHRPAHFDHRESAEEEGVAAGGRSGDDARVDSERQIQAYLTSLGVGIPAAQFIGRVSNLYHEAESAYYDRIHPELDDALEVWRDCLGTIAPQLPPRISVLDIGAGTGFASAAVVEAFGQRLSRLVCLDPSAAMLAKARERLASVTPPPHFVVGELGVLAEQPAFDLIVTNSVLHHLPDIQQFLRSVRALLRPGGIYVAGHEPCREFFEHRALRGWTGLYRRWRRVRRLLSPATYRRRLEGRADETDPEGATVAALLRQGLIERPLPAGVVRQLIDIHVPGNDAGLGLGLPGLSRDDLLSGALQGFDCRVSTSYSHIKDSRASMGPAWRLVDRWLARRYPSAGSNFLIAVRRPD